MKCFGLNVCARCECTQTLSRSLSLSLLRAALSCLKLSFLVSHFLALSCLPLCLFPASFLPLPKPSLSPPFPPSPLPLHAAHPAAQTFASRIAHKFYVNCSRTGAAQPAQPVRQHLAKSNHTHVAYPDAASSVPSPLFPFKHFAREIAT